MLCYESAEEGSQCDKSCQNDEDGWSIHKNILSSFQLGYLLLYCYYVLN